MAEGESHPRQRESPTHGRGRVPPMAEGESHPWQRESPTHGRGRVPPEAGYSSMGRGSSFVLGKVTALGVLRCFALFVCLTLLASFFLPSHLSFKNMYIHMYIHVDDACPRTSSRWARLLGRRCSGRSVLIQESLHNLFRAPLCV